MPSGGLLLADVNLGALACVLHTSLLMEPEFHHCWLDSDSSMLQNEAKTLQAFQADPYGCHGDLLAKKEARDPFALGPYDGHRCPGMSGLLDYCSDTLYRERLPWD